MKRVQYRRSRQPLARAVAVIAAVTILVTGVTYASLQSQQEVLAGNSIKTATANLQIGTSDGTFGTSRNGFSYEDVLPGGAAVPVDGNVFYLKNGGTPALALKAAVSSTPTNSSSVDLSKVYLVLERTDTHVSQKLALADLATAYTGGGVALTDNLSGGATAQYKARVQMDADAFTGTNADITGIDIVFSGTAVTD